MNFEQKQHILWELKSAICKWANCLCTHAKRFVSHEIILKPNRRLNFKCSWHLLWVFFFPLLFLKIMCNNFCMRQRKPHLMSKCCLLSSHLPDNTQLSHVHTLMNSHTYTHTRQSQITNKVASISKCLLFWHWTKIHQLIMCCEKQKLPQCSVHKREANQQVWTWPHFIQFLEQNKCKFFSK